MRVRLLLFDGTDLEGRPFQTIERLESEREWTKCWVEDGKVNGVGGPQKLEEILEVFLSWANSPN